MLILLMVALQAMPSKPLPTQLDNGPAFSASSYEVGVPVRRADVADARVIPTPTTPQPPSVTSPISFRVTPRYWHDNRQTAPPAPFRQTGDPARAPPAA